MHSWRGAMLAVLLLPGIGLAEDQPAIEDAADRASYSLGYQIGGDLERQSAEIDADGLLRGLQEALDGTAPSIPPEEMNAILVGLKRKIENAQRQQKREIAEKRRVEGEEFLAANAKKPGVITLPSGLQYKVLREGEGKSPGPSDEVEVHYRGTLIDGTEFHNSFREEGETETLPVSGVIRGLTEALQLMREGARWQLFVPADLAYARRGPLADRTVIYEVELVSIAPGE